MTTVTLSASVTDSDGSIQSYLWRQNSGVSLELENTDQASVRITTPDIDQDEIAVLSLTATDNDGAETTAEVSVTILAATALTVQGIVTDNPVANATVRFFVGEEIYETSADANGLYQINLNPSLSLGDAIVRAEATAPGVNSQLKLVSLLGDLSQLQREAGDDRTLTSSENLNVNITNITTSAAGLIAQQHPEGITTGVELAKAKKSIIGEQALRTAVGIKLILDYDFDIPEGISDTFAFASDLNASARFVELSQLNQSEAYYSALQEMVDDQYLSAATVIENNDDTYYFFNPAIKKPASIPLEGYLQVMSRLTLNSDGSGQIFTNQTRDITWAATNSGLTISDPGQDFQIENEYRSDLGYSVQAIRALRIKRLKWLDSSKISAHFLVEAETYLQYPEHEGIPDSDPIALPAFSMNGVRTAGTVNAADVLQLDRNYSMVVAQHNGEVTNYTESVSPEFSISALEMAFSGSSEQSGNVTLTKESITGNGTPTETHSVANWHIGDNGDIILSEGEGHTSEIIFLSDDPQAPKVWSSELRDDTNTASTGIALLKESSNWTSQNVVGIYRHLSDFFQISEPFWFELNADGTALTVSTIDTNKNGTISDDEKFLMPGLWKINDDGNVLIRRYRSDSEYCTPLIWDPAADAECMLYHEREWQLQSLTSSGKHRVKHNHRFFWDFIRSAYPDASPDEHILGSAYSFNIEFDKINSRPLPLPAE